MKVLNMEMHGQLTCTSSDGSRLGSRELHKRVSSECDGGDVSRQKSLHDAPGDFRPHATDPFVDIDVTLKHRPPLPESRKIETLGCKGGVLEGGLGCSQTSKV